MNDEASVQTQAEKIMEKIRTGQVSMKPKAFFVARSFLAMLGIVIIFAFAIFLASYVLFYLRLEGFYLLPQMGLPGIRALLLSLPWTLLVLVGIFVVILEIVSKHFAFAYRKPLVYSFVGIVVCVTLGSWLVSMTGLHDAFIKGSSGTFNPITAPVYQILKPQESNDYVLGRVVRHPGSLKVQTRGGDVVNVKFPEEFNEQADSYNENDLLMIVGPRADATITAIGIHKDQNKRNVEYFEKNRIKKQEKTAEDSKLKDRQEESGGQERAIEDK